MKFTGYLDWQAECDVATEEPAQEALKQMLIEYLKKEEQPFWIMKSEDVRNPGQKPGEQE